MTTSAKRLQLHTFPLALLACAVLALAGCAQTGKAPLALTLLHTNDTHSQLESFTPAGEVEQGGVARRKTLINAVRAEVGPERVLLVDSGDFSQGTIFYNAWKGSADIMALNDLGYDVGTLGNHEFDLGPRELGRALRGEKLQVAGQTYPAEALAMPLVSSNLDVSQEPALAGLIKKSVVIERGGGKIGVIGVITETVTTIAATGGKISVGGYLESVQREADRLQAAGIDKIVLLSHVGYWLDKQLAPQLSGVDIIVSGHDHQLLLPPALYLPGAAAALFAGRVAGDYPTVTRDRNGNPLLIVSSYEWGKILGRLDVDFDASGVLTGWQGKPQPVTANVAAEPALAARVAAYKAPLDAFSRTSIGSTMSFFDGSRIPGLRSQEMPLGNLVADAILAAAKAYGGAAAALINGGSIRAGLPQGDASRNAAPPYPVNFGQALAVLPFGNTIVSIDVTGADLVRALDNGLTWAFDPAGGSARSSGAFPQVAGLQARFCGQTVTAIQSGTHPPPPCPDALVAGGVVTGLQIGGQAVDLGAVYRLATNSFVADGGDFFRSLKEACQRPGGYCVDTGILVVDALVGEFAHKSPLQRRVEGRLSSQ